MKTWNDFMDSVMPEVPGCELAMATHAIRQSAIEFCELAHVMQVDHPAIDAVAGLGEYPWAPGANLKVCHVVAVRYAGKRLDPTSEGELEGMYDSWPEEEGTPERYLQERPEALFLVPAPNADLVGAITAKVAVKPAQAATEIDDDIWEKYLDAIAAGAKHRLMRMKRKPWTDLDMAAFYSGKFEEAITKARNGQQYGQVKARKRASPKWC